MAEITYPKFFEIEGSIFRVSEVNGILIAEVFDTTSRTFKRVKSSADVFWEGKEIFPNDLPPEIKEVM